MNNLTSRIKETLLGTSTFQQHRSKVICFRHDNKIALVMRMITACLEYCSGRMFRGWCCLGLYGVGPPHFVPMLIMKLRDGVVDKEPLSQSFAARPRGKQHDCLIKTTVPTVVKWKWHYCTLQYSISTISKWLSRFPVSSLSNNRQRIHGWVV